MILASIFHQPMQLSGDCMLWLLAPICASIAVVYKTLRTTNLRRLPLQIAALMAYMLIGLTVLGAGLWAIHEYWR